MLARLLFVSFAVITFAGCKPPSDLGTPCTMVKRDPNVDGGRLFVRNKEIKVGANKDFISFGSVDCENLVCVRDADFAVPDGGFDPEAVAQGYCSNRCAIVGDICPSVSADDDNDAKRRLTCRPLLLDAETLALICNGSAEDKAKCKAYFGNTSRPEFCARGGSVSDAGT